MPKFISPADPAARWTGAHRGPAFFAYSTNYLIDLERQVYGSARRARNGKHGRDAE
jgi:hypothetical protein